MKLNIQENYIIYGKVICTHCGSDHELMHVETPFCTDTIICKTCFREEIPTGDDIQALVNKEVSENFTIEELKEFSNFEEFWDIIDAQNTYQEDWEAQSIYYKGLYLSAYQELLEEAELYEHDEEAFWREPEHGGPSQGDIMMTNGEAE